MTGPLKNERHERMAQEMAKGTGDFGAFRSVGFTGGPPAASKIANRPEVRARVAELLKRAADRAEVTVADIAKQLDEDREFAKAQGQAGACVSASMGKAKVLGLIKERHEHTGRNGGPIEYRDLSEEEVDERLEDLVRRHGPAPLAH